MTWESAIPPSACAIAAFGVCMHSVRILPPSMTDLSHKHAKGTPCLLLDRHVTNYPRKIICHFAVCDPVRPSPSPHILYPSRSRVRYHRAHTREARANLADITNLTHFPTLTNSSEPGSWSVAQNEYGQSDPGRDTHPPVRVRRPRLFLILRRTYSRFSLQLSLVAYKADDTSGKESTPACPPPV